MRSIEDIQRDLARVEQEIIGMEPAVTHYNNLLAMRADLNQEIFTWKINNGQYYSIVKLSEYTHKIPLSIELVIIEDHRVTTKMLVNHMRLTSEGYIDYEFDNKKLYHDPNSLDPHDYIFQHYNDVTKLKLLGYLNVEFAGG